MQSAGDTIAAVATPFGEGAIALLRLSGPEAVPIAARWFRGQIPPDRWRPGRQMFGRWVDTDGRAVDDVLLTVRRGPASYTGEDLVEVSCHGGIVVTRQILALLMEAGARMAGPGEFTQRAFLNGRLDLTQAEAVMDLISARTGLAARAAAAQLEGGLRARIEALREQLLLAIAHLEAWIDFPEEDIDPDSGAALRARFDEVGAGVGALLGTAGRGRALREGVRTVIAGEPNVGKSSLLNRLLGYDRAIVSETPGTTRDTIEEVIDLRGIPLRLIDTAGLRETGDAIELEGVARARRHLETADLVLRVVDGSAPPGPVAPGDVSGGTVEILVLNKSDLPPHASWAGREGIRVSCRTGEGFDRLEERIVSAAGIEAAGAGEELLAVNARHQAALGRARDRIAAASAALVSGTDAEFVAVDAREALEALGEIVGAVTEEDVLDRIFARFCIGK